MGHLYKINKSQWDSPEFVESKHFVNNGVPVHSIKTGLLAGALFPAAFAGVLLIYMRRAV
jgi:hypothetical protein